MFGDDELTARLTGPFCSRCEYFCTGEGEDGSPLNDPMFLGLGRANSPDIDEICCCWTVAVDVSGI